MLKIHQPDSSMMVTSMEFRGSKADSYQLGINPSEAPRGNFHASKREGGVKSLLNNEGIKVRLEEVADTVVELVLPVVELVLPVVAFA